MPDLFCVLRKTRTGPEKICDLFFYGHAVKRNGFHVKTDLFVLFKPLNALKSAILRKKAIFSGFVKIFIRLLVRFIKN